MSRIDLKRRSGVGRWSFEDLLNVIVVMWSNIV